MSYEKPSFVALGLVTSATREVGYGDNYFGCAGKHSPVYEGCTSGGPQGWETIDGTSSTGGAYEVDE